MKLLAVFCLIATVAAAPPSKRYYSPQNVQVLRYENENFGLGRHRYAFELSDGTKQEQRGELKNVGGDDEAYVVTGSYTWIGPDGRSHIVNYVADENGYQPDIEDGPGGLPYDVTCSLCG